MRGHSQPLGPVAGGFASRTWAEAPTLRAAGGLGLFFGGFRVFRVVRVVRVFGVFRVWGLGFFRVFRVWGFRGIGFLSVFKAFLALGFRVDRVPVRVP